MMRPTVPDQAARLEALDRSGSFILEAPAGSGKTDLLIARYLSLLAHVSHPRQIMALTYTRKAAAEMTYRITRKLNEAREQGTIRPEDPWEDRLLSLAVRALARHKDHPSVLFNPESLQVSTFHSFCASLVKSWPLEARVPPGLGLLEDIEQESLPAMAVARYLDDVVSGRSSIGERDACERYLVAMNNNSRLLSEQLENIIRRRDRLVDLLPLFAQGEGPMGRELNGRLEHYAALYLQRLQDYFSRHDDDWTRLREILVKGGTSPAADFPSSVPGVSIGDIVNWKKAAHVFLARSSGTPRKQFRTADGFPKDFKEGSSARFIKELRPEIARSLAFVAEWPDPAGDNVGLVRLADLLPLIGGTIVRLEQLIRERGMDYLELELAALRTLQDVARPSESLIFYHDHLRHILVDEAQDLNDLQVKILGRMTEGWEPGDGRTVFFVGDPKQSIYRFRRSEVSLFYDIEEHGLPRKGEAPLPLRFLTLFSNFRSRAHLVRFSNSLFEDVMAPARREYDEVRFIPSEEVRDEGDELVPVTVAIFQRGEDQEDGGPLPLEREAGWVAASVARLHEERPEDTIGILIRARSCLSVYVEALRGWGVAVRLTEGLPLLDRPEVSHLLNLFTAMVRPYDDVAWASTLRAPWLFVSNQVLYSLKPGRGLWSTKILSAKDLSPEVKILAEAVEEVQKMFGRESYASTLQRLWEDLDGPRATAARYGAAGVSNVRVFLDLLGQCSGYQGEEALSRVSRLAESSYTPPDPQGFFSRVRMMTIHKAKGLEFDHVFAVNLDYDPRGKGDQPAYRMERLPGEERHLLIAAMGDRRSGEENLAYHLLRDLDGRRSSAESRRIFYVVATRARESLTLTGVKRRGTGGRETPLAWLLDWTENVPPALQVSVLENPEPSPANLKEESAILPSIIPSFEAEPLPYRIVSPSKVDDETSLPVLPGAEEEGDLARARGVVIHRILDALARERTGPSAGAVASALVKEGIPRGAATEMSGQVLEEALAAWEFPEFRALRSRAREFHPEWAIEDFDREYDLRVGRIDLLLKIDERWVLVDYKTGRPERDVDVWVNTQVRHYRPQLTAYCQMAARRLSVPEARVEGMILFTALPLLVRQRE